MYELPVLGASPQTTVVTATWPPGLQSDGQQDGSGRARPSVIRHVVVAGSHVYPTGAWPISRVRVAACLRKAMREAKTATPRTDPAQLRLTCWPPRLSRYSLRRDDARVPGMGATP